jgi:glycosyltransferase involved in cell wall biosynthesis
MPPALSVIVPVYNGGEYLEKTLHSVFDQSFADWELLVIDNASSDSTPALLERIQAQRGDPRLRLLRNETTIPAVENWNRAIAEARGEFLKVICADDLPAPGSFQTQVEALRKHPGVVLCTGSRVIIDAQGKKLFTTDRLGGRGVIPGKEALRRCALAGTNIIGDPVHVTWRRSAMERAGSFDPSVPYATDLDFWLNLLGAGDLYYDPAPSGLYRIHGGANSSGQWKSTTDWVMAIFRKQAERGHLRFSRAAWLGITAKAYFHGFARGQVYRFLG